MAAPAHDRHDPVATKVHDPLAHDLHEDVGHHPPVLHRDEAPKLPLGLRVKSLFSRVMIGLYLPSIFQGLAISLMAGEVASLLLSRMTAPITYFMTHRRPRRAVGDPVIAA